MREHSEQQAATPAEFIRERQHQRVSEAEHAGIEDSGQCDLGFWNVDLKTALDDAGDQIENRYRQKCA